MGYAEVASQYERYLNPGFIRLLGMLGYGRLMTRAEGLWTWDDQGRKYLDFVAGFGSHNLGHHPPAVVGALRAALEEQPYTFLHTGPSAAAADLAEALARRMPEPLSMSMFSSSGAEAVEGAMKLAIAATGRSRFVFMESAFHGTSLGALSVMGKDKFREPFEAVLARHERVPFDDLAALERALHGKDVAAVIAEPVLAEGGVRFPSPGYLDEALRLCRKHKALLVLDEIQTGLGRTGRFLACETMREAPDVVCLAKSLSGGLLPISATITTRAVYDRVFKGRDDFDLHSSTFGGNALSCRVARATLEAIDSEGLVARSARMGALLLDKLRAALAGHPLVRDIRGEGLLVGVELSAGLLGAGAQGVIGQWMALCLLEKGILLQPSSHRWEVLKFEPPLTIGEAEIDLAVGATLEVFNRYRSLPALGVAITQRLGKQFLGGLF